jgi:signal transduction histidine kinase
MLRRYQARGGWLIQTTPEKPGKGGGVRRAYRSWPVFGLALSVLLGLMVVPAVTAWRRSEQIYSQVRSSQAQFQTGQSAFQAVAEHLSAISITIREFLLDSSPDAVRTYGARLDRDWQRLDAGMARLRASLPPDVATGLTTLEPDLDAYRTSTHSIFAWRPAERAERGAYFLREEHRPRRASILAVTERLADLNAALYAQHQQRASESEERFRADLVRSVEFALLAGVAVAAAGMLRIRSLERRAREQHQQAQQTSDEMRSLSVQLRHAQEEERRTISRELHDEVGQQLTAMRMELGSLERLRGSATGEFETTLAEVKELAERSLRDIRGIAAGLRPSVLDDLGLGAALRRQAREFTKRTGTLVDVSIDGDFEGLADTQRIYVYRIVQEALTNCARHARARHITVTLAQAGQSLELTVRDDGVGFDVGTVAHSGLGLIGMEERVRELGGIIAVHSAPNQGTTIAISLPGTAAAA